MWSWCFSFVGSLRIGTTTAIRVSADRITKHNQYIKGRTLEKIRFRKEIIQPEVHGGVNRGSVRGEIDIKIILKLIFFRTGGVL